MLLKRISEAPSLVSLSLSLPRLAAALSRARALKIGIGIHPFCIVCQTGRNIDDLTNDDVQRVASKKEYGAMLI